MYVWFITNCAFCHGLGVNARKDQYLPWLRMLLAAKDKVVKENKPIIILQIVHKKIDELVKDFPPCSFCDGTGVFRRREAVDLDDSTP